MSSSHSTTPPPMANQLPLPNLVSVRYGNNDGSPVLPLTCGPVEQSTATSSSSSESEEKSKPRYFDQPYSLSIGRLLVFQSAVMLAQSLGEDASKAKSALEYRWLDLYGDADFIFLENMRCPKCETDHRGPGPHVKSRPVHHALNTLYERMAAHDPMTLTQADLSKYNRLWHQIEDRYLLENRHNRYCDGLARGSNRDPNYDDAVHHTDSQILDASRDNEYRNRPRSFTSEEIMARSVWNNIERTPGDNFEGSVWDTDDIVLKPGEWQLEEEDDAVLENDDSEMKGQDDTVLSDGDREMVEDDDDE